MEENKNEVLEEEDNLELDEEEKPQVKESNESEPQKQSRKVNSYYANLRRNKERNSTDYNEGLKEGLKGTNPYTGTPITDDADIELYKIQKELDEEGKDPIKGLADYILTTKRKELEEVKRKEDARKDIVEFKEKHKGVDVDGLLKNQDFLTFAEGKLGNMSLTKIFDDYSKLVSKKEETPKKKQTMPSSVSGEIKTKSVKDMSEKEFWAKYYETFPRS